MRKLLAIVGLLVCVAAQATNYYVKPAAEGGSDSANGLTPATAFATISKGATSSGPGDTVLVWSDANPPANFAATTITTSGADGNPRTIIGSNGVTCSQLVLSGAKWNQIVGLHFTGGGAFADGEMSFTSGAHSNTVAYCWFTNIVSGENAVYIHSGNSNKFINNSFGNLTNNTDVFQLHGQNNWLTTNNFFNITNCDIILALGLNLRIGPGNLFSNLITINPPPPDPQFHNDLIQSFVPVTGGVPSGGTTTPVATNVWFFGNYAIACPGFQLCNLEDQCNYNLVRDFRFFNNVITAPGWYQANIYSKDTVFENNTFYHPGSNIQYKSAGSRTGHAATDKGFPDNLIFNNNITATPTDSQSVGHIFTAGTNQNTGYNVWFTPSGLPLNNVFGVNNINGGLTATTLFVNAAAFDFQPLTNSLVYSASYPGVDFSANFTVDFYGTTRSVPWIRGAILNGSVPTPPPAITASVYLLKNRAAILTR